MYLGKKLIIPSSPFFQVPEVSHQEVSEKEQPQGLVESGGQHQGELRAALLPDQPGRRGGRGRRLKPTSLLIKIQKREEK